MKGVSFEYPMYYGAKPSIFKLDKELRKNETMAEKVLWSKINRNQIIGLQFRRQHPINMFIADFFCSKIKLVIEIMVVFMKYPRLKYMTLVEVIS